MCILKVKISECKWCISDFFFFSRIVKTQDFNHQIDRYSQMLNHLVEFENIIFGHWATAVPQICEDNLTKTILIQDEDTLELSLNFDDEVR